MEEQNIAHVFAQNIARFRKRRGLSQYDLARVTGISRRMISHYESDGAIPPGDRLQALATALETSVSKLFEDHAGKTEPIADLTDIDPRSVKKFRDILSLSAEDRNDLYRILNKMLRKSQLEQEKQVSNTFERPLTI
jgi:transcriptional regulator with XRE-family HTH domain